MLWPVILSPMIVHRPAPRWKGCTHTLPGAKAMYLPIKTSDKTYAVMGIVLEERREIPAFEYGLLTAMVNEAALVFARILKEKEK